MQMSAEMQWEIREALAGLRARGKKVVVYIDYANIYEYAMASVADQLWIDPVGGLDVRGLATGRTFMRRAFDKLGLGVDEWRFFKYKSAFEGYSRDSMSPPDREQRQALIDDFYEEVARQVTSARSLSREQWDAIVNEKGVLLAGEARAAGLVDSLGSFDQAKASARRAARRAGGDASATELAGVTGDPVWGPQEWGEPPRIAVLYAIGECAMDTGIRGRKLSKEIKKAREDRSVKAVVLRADSPGGEVLPSDLVAREMLETAKRKPVIVSQGAVAASGGYWISMFADSIVASPVTITGSIGVIAGWIWNKEFGDKIGFTFDGVKRGEHADLGLGIRLPLAGVMVPDRPPTVEERDRAERLIRDTYQDFVTKVAAGRGLDPKRVDEIGQGRVWTGSRGKEIGLVDELGGLWRTLQMAKAAARIPGKRPVEFQEGPWLGTIDLSALRPRFPTGAEVAPLTSPLTEAEAKLLRLMIEARGGPVLMTDPIEIEDGSKSP
jgi:protease-4